MRGRTTTLAVAALGVSVALAACGQASSPGTLNGGGENGDPGATGNGNNGNNGTPGTGTGSPSGPTTPGTPSNTPGTGGDPDAGNNPNIVNRAVDYGEALRTASLKLVGDLPAMADITAIDGATSDAQRKTIYEGLIDKMLADPRFATTQVAWWRNTLKTGGPAVAGGPSFDTAATFAASVVVQDRPFTDLFTATTGTCPTFANGTFTAANCTGTQQTAGILGDPGLMAQYFSNMAFRRVRFVQETFACAKFPAEFGKTPTPMGSGVYTSPWDFNSISGGAGSKIDFHDTSAVICANCHTTMNHLAPLFANFDAKGVFSATTIAVMTPVTPAVKTVLADWLPAGQALAWRNGATVTDLATLGQAMAKDADVLRCAVNRVWNWAFSHGDIVNDLAAIPPVVTDALTQSFTANGVKLKAVIRSTFTSDDFVRF